MLYVRPILRCGCSFLNAHLVRLRACRAFPSHQMHLMLAHVAQYNIASLSKVDCPTVQSVFSVIHDFACDGSGTAYDLATADLGLHANLRFGGHGVMGA